MLCHQRSHSKYCVKTRASKRHEGVASKGTRNVRSSTMLKRLLKAGRFREFSPKIGVLRTGSEFQRRIHSEFSSANYSSWCSKSICIVNLCITIRSMHSHQLKYLLFNTRVMPFRQGNQRVRRTMSSRRPILDDPIAACPTHAYGDSHRCLCLHWQGHHMPSWLY